MITTIILIIAIAIIGRYTYHVAANPRIIGKNYMTRFFAIPRNKWLNIYVHKYTGSDDDRACHDHPWWSVSFLIKGSITEVKRHTVCDKVGVGDMLPRCRTWNTIKPVKRLLPVIRGPLYAHRLILNSPTACTIFITGPKLRSWGFYCPKGWVPWRKFTDETGNIIGRGCE